VGGVPMSPALDLLLTNHERTIDSLRAEIGHAKAEESKAREEEGRAREELCRLRANDDRVKGDADRARRARDRAEDEARNLDAKVSIRMPERRSQCSTINLYPRDAGTDAPSSSASYAGVTTRLRTCTTLCVRVCATTSWPLLPPRLRVSCTRRSSRRFPPSSRTRHHRAFRLAS
jgi:hypothetical protein